ncbi:MAG: M81 family metallopeptidase [Pseudomonadota bacterium]
MTASVRVSLAMMSHETNTFSPVITDLARFSRYGDRPSAGAEAIELYTGTKSCLGGYLNICAERGIVPSLSIAASAPPSGPVEDEAFEFMVERIVAGARDCDLLLLDLHGAMVTRSHDDGEGELLRRIRAVAPAIPIAVSLDMHANLTDAMVENATVIAGYQTYPHVDMDTTAERAARMLFRALDGDCMPVMRWGNAPMLPHVMRQGTDDEPNRALQARARAAEKDGDRLVSVFTGFPHADIPTAGLSAVVVSDDNPADAERLRDELLDQAWAARESFVYRSEPIADSLARAAGLAANEPSNGEAAGPVILLDHYDNTASGGTMDTTEVLRGVLEAGLQDVAVFGFFDPGVVAQMVEAGVGAEVEVELGGKLAMPALRRQSAPLPLTGRVKLIADGSFPATVAMSRGLQLHMGTTAVLALPNDVDVVVVSRHIEPFDPGCLRSLGIEPTTRRFVMLKSRIHYRVGFRDIARAVVECAGVGVCTSDYSELTFENVRRPIYPLDGINATARADLS